MKVYANGALVDSELLVLDRQAKEGDAVSGWRGDPSLWVEVHNTDEGQTVWVMGRDARGTKYGAASIRLPCEGWRHKLLDKLVLGDWQHRAGDPIQRVLDANKARTEAITRNLRTYEREELFPKLHWAIAKDNAGFRRDFFMTPRKGA